MRKKNRAAARSTAGHQAGTKRVTRRSPRVDDFSATLEAFESEVQRAASALGIESFQARRLVRMRNGVVTLRDAIAEQMGMPNDAETCAELKVVTSAEMNDFQRMIENVAFGDPVGSILRGAFLSLWYAEESLLSSNVEGAMESLLNAASFLPQLANVTIEQERRLSAEKAANALHDKPGGSRAKQAAIRKIWASGHYTSRDRCAEEECAALDMSLSAARKALRNTPDPS